MRKKCLIQVLGVVFLAALVSPALLAQSTDVDQRIADLQKQVEALRAELAALKPKPAEAAPAPASANNLTATTTQAPAAPNPLAGISNVLGGATISGLVDAYYGFNSNHPIGGTATTPFTVTNSQFSLNMIELVLDKTPDKDAPLGYHVGLGWGQAMDAVNNTDPYSVVPGSTKSAQFLKEGYLSYLAPIGKGLQIDAGKFVTEHGAEVIESNANWNYSRSLLFTYAIPYYHFGMRAKYTFNDKYSMAAFLVNGWNNIIDNNTGKTVGFTFGWNPTKKLSITQNYMGGPEQLKDNGDWRHLYDTEIAYTVTPKLSLLANIDYGREMKWLATNHSADWSGVAGYVRYAFTPKAAIVGRYEYLNDHAGWATGTQQHMQEVTATVERKIATHMISRLEYRHDLSNHNFFDKSGTSLVKDQNTVLAGLMFVLEPSESK
jgi:hypothetical protein